MKENSKTESAGKFVDAIINIRQAIKHHFQMRLKEIHGLEITYEMFQVLTVLWNTHQVQINQQEIANSIQKGKASLTPLIDNLVRINLVSRMEDPADRRNKIIELTREGKQYEKKFQPLFDEFYALIQGDLSNKKLEEITGLILQMRNRI